MQNPTIVITKLVPVDHSGRTELKFRYEITIQRKNGESRIGGVASIDEPIEIEVEQNGECVPPIHKRGCNHLFDGVEIPTKR